MSTLPLHWVCRHKGPFLNTAKGNVPSTFSSFGVYTAFQSFKDAGIKPISLFEQYRTYHARFASMLITGHEAE